MSQTNKQTLERDVLNAVHRYQLDAHTSATNATQTAMEILGKYAQVPRSMRYQTVRTVKPKWWERLRSVFGKVGA